MIQEGVVPLVVQEKVLELGAQPRVVPAGLAQKGRPSIAWQVCRRVDQRLQALPAFGAEW